MQTGDVFGNAVKDYLDGEKHARIAVFSDISDKGYIDVNYLFRDSENMPPLEIVALHNSKGKILDIGAGAGSHSLVLQQNGMDITAFEKSPGCCRAMESRGIQKIVNTDIFDYRGNKYDTLLMLMNGIGLCGDIFGYMHFLEHARKLLKKNGNIIFDSSDVVYMLDDPESGIIDVKNNKYYGIVKYWLTYKNIKSDPFPWLFLDEKTMREIAVQSGYKVTLLAHGNHFDYLAKLTLV
jgi:hypothetical protein